MSTPGQIRAAVEAYFDTVPSRSTKDELVFICTCGDKTGNRSVNLKTGQTNCWRCNHGGHIKSWARGLGIELDLDDAPTGTSFDDIETALAEIEEPPLQNTVDVVMEVPLPRGFVPLTLDAADSYTRLAGVMANRKHLYLEDLVEAGAGIAPDNQEWSGFVIFPVVEWGRVVYYQGRTMIDPAGGTTKKFPSRAALPRGSRYWIYGVDELRANGGIAIVVESILNVLSLRYELRRRNLTGYIPVAVFKHHVSPEQTAKFSRLRNIDELVFLYDADATAAADQEANKFINRFKRVSVAPMPEGDANDNAALAVDMILNRRAPEVLTL